MAFDARCFPEVLTVTTRRVLLDTIIGHGIGNTLRALAPDMAGSDQYDQVG